MKFEELANELLVELFEFIDFIHLLRTFYGLNSRLNHLIFIHYRTYHLNFRSISKREFDIVCQQHLPLIINRVISLYLSNDDETPNLPEFFFFYDFNLNQFYRLRSLSLDCIHSLSFLNQIIFECQDLPYFTHLSILKCNFKNPDYFSYLIKTIWNLPKLIYCKIDHQFLYELKFSNDTIISLSIKNLSVENFNFNLNDLSNLFQYSFWFSTEFRNVHHLKIHFPLTNPVWSFVQSLNQLISIDVTLIEGSSYLPLQILLDQSPSLSSLCLGNFNNLQIISQLTCASIYRLDFIKKNKYKRYFDSTQCYALANSSLGRQCQILLINVENRMNILQLINSMSNLRSLTFQCKDDKFNNELIQWLHDHLSSRCSITTDKYQTSNIRLWIN